MHKCGCFSSCLWFVNRSFFSQFYARKTKLHGKLHAEGGIVSWKFCDFLNKVLPNCLIKLQKFSLRSILVPMSKFSEAWIINHSFATFTIKFARTISTIQMIARQNFTDIANQRGRTDGRRIHIKLHQMAHQMRSGNKNVIQRGIKNARVQNCDLLNPKIGTFK